MKSEIKFNIFTHYNCAQKFRNVQYLAFVFYAKCRKTQMTIFWEKASSHPRKATVFPLEPKSIKSTLNM